MPCPKCSSHDLWDDNLAWGCNSCEWFTTGGVRNAIEPEDTFNVVRTTKFHVGHKRALTVGGSRADKVLRRFD